MVGTQPYSHLVARHCYLSESSGKTTSCPSYQVSKEVAPPIYRTFACKKAAVTQRRRGMEWTSQLAEKVILLPTAQRQRKGDRIDLGCADRSKQNCFTLSFGDVLSNSKIDMWAGNLLRWPRRSYSGCVATFSAWSATLSSWVRSCIDPSRLGDRIDFVTSFWLLKMQS